MNKKFKGILPAIVSPCNEDDIFLEEQFAELAKSLYQSGVQGLYVCGGTGDGWNMRLEERKRAAEIAVEVSKEFNGTIIVHVGTTNTRDAVELAEHAASSGADAVSSIPPFSRGQDELVNYYTDIAKAVQIPVLVYCIPMLTKVTPTVDEMLQLLDIEGVIGLKITEWNLFFMKRLLLRRPDITIFSGFDEFLLPGLLYGAHGGIGTWYNLFPKLFIAIYQAVSEGNISRAQKIQNVFLSFSDLAWEHDVKQVFEFLMRERGLAQNCFRHPRQTLDKSERETILPELNKRIEAIDEVIKQ